MIKVIIPPLKKIPEGATREDRERMFDEHVSEVKRLNPKHYNNGDAGPLSGTKRWFVAAIISVLFFVVVALIG